MLTGLIITVFIVNESDGLTRGTGFLLLFAGFPYSWEIRYFFQLFPLSENRQGNAVSLHFAEILF